MDPQNLPPQAVTPAPLSPLQIAGAKTCDNLMDCLDAAQRHVGRMSVDKMRRNSAMTQREAVEESHAQMLESFNDLHGRMSEAHKVAIGSAYAIVLEGAASTVGLNPSFVRKSLVCALFAGAAAGAFIGPKIARVFSGPETPPTSSVAAPR